MSRVNRSRPARAGASLVIIAMLIIGPAAAPPASASTITLVPGLPADQAAMVGGPATTVYDPADESPAWQPIANAFDGGTVAAPTRMINIGFKEHYDFDPYSNGLEIRSSDGGRTYSAPVPQDVVEVATRRSDGKIIGAIFKGQGHTNPPSSTFTMKLRIAADDDPNVGTDLIADVDISPLIFFHPTNQFFPTAIVQVPQGPLLMAGYSNLRDADGVMRTSSYLLQSTDGGAHWTLRSVIAASTAALQYNETGMVLDAGGDLLVAIRDSRYSQFNLRRSTDLGLTWGPITTPVLADGQEWPARIMPRLELLPNGILALESGRLDNWVAVSFAGDGRVWDRAYRFYTNHNDAQPTDPNEGSSGNGGLAVVAANRIAAFADSCHPFVRQGVRHNKCIWQSPPMTDTEEFMIKQSLIDVLTPGTGKIDLAGKLRAGRISITSDLGAVAGRPRTGAAGAIDGSTELWSGAFRSGTGDGTYEIELDREYTLAKVGLSLMLGTTQDAVVQTKRTLDDPWTTWHTATGQESYALRYSPDTLAPVRARYVRISTGAASACPPGVAAPCSGLNELELYAADVDSFENDPVDGIPRGWAVRRTVDDGGTAHLGVWVSTSTSGSGTGRAMRIVDDSTEHLPLAQQDTGSSVVKSLEFRFKADQWRPAQTGAPDSMFRFGLRTATGVAYQLGVAATGELRWYDDAAGTWSTVGAVRADPAGWSTIRVQAGPRSAQLFVDGRRVGAVARSDAATTPMIGHQFSGSATAYAQESFVVDDVVTGPEK